MTYDELVEKVNKYCEDITSGQVWTTDVFIKALRAVVELHKPQPTTIPTDPKCTECSGLDWADYPCKTIQAIEKELG